MTAATLSKQNKKNNYIFAASVAGVALAFAAVHYGSSRLKDAVTPVVPDQQAEFVPQNLPVSFPW
jgi:hypothetical protein